MYLLIGFTLTCLGMFLLIAFVNYEKGLLWLSHWFDYQIQLIHGMNIDSWFSKNTLWFAWPIWPYAILCLYLFKKEWRRTHILVPLIFVIGFLLLGCFTSCEARTILMAALPGLSILAGFGLLSSKDKIRLFLDWFSAYFFSILILILWIVFFLWHSQKLDFINHFFEYLSPGIKPYAHGFWLVLAIISTFIWAALMLWKLIFKTSIMWKGPWLAAAGVVTMVILINSLFSKAIDANQSYRPLVQTINSDFAELTKSSDCFNMYGLDSFHEKLFHYWGLASSKEKCRYKFTQLESLNNLGIWDYRRIGKVYTRPDKHEVFLFIDTLR